MHATRHTGSTLRASLLLGAALLAPLVACRRSPQPTTLGITYRSEILSLDPAAPADAETGSVLSNMYEGLVAFDKDMHLVPALATSWNVLDDHTWLVNLRRNVRFHDGGTLTAVDVKFSLERSDSLALVKQVDVIDEGSLRLRTLWPDALLLNRLTHVLIVPRGRQAQDYDSQPIGTGPYRFVRWERGTRLTLEAFPDYWGGRPPVDRVEFLPLDVPRAREALAQGRVDVLALPRSMVRDLQAPPGVRIERRPGLAAAFLWFRSMQEQGKPRDPFADGRVRRAVSLAIERRKLIESLGGNGTPANQLLARGVFGYVSALPELPFDPGAARTLLAEAGYPRGFDTNLVCPDNDTRPACASIKQMLDAIGIRATVETVPWSSFVSRWARGQLPFFLATWRFDDGDALSFLRDCLFTRDPARKFGSYNPGFSSAPLDQLIEETERTPGETQRLLHYEKVMRMALLEMPIVPLYHPDNVYAVSEKLRWQPRVDGNLLAAEMSPATR
jgi:peptide/nickel transport system substrate-binding protein